MKKILSLIFTVVAVTLMVACNKEANQLEFANSENVMAFQALTSVQVVENEPTEETPIVVVPEENEQDNPEVIVTDEQVEAIEEVSPYISMFENLLSQKDGLIEEVKVSDLEDYEHMQVFNIPNILDGSEKSILYYNIISLDRDEDDEDESMFKIEGLIIKGNSEFKMIGEKEVEDNEQTIKMKTYINENKYIETVHETESDESEYFVRHVENGKTIYESKLEIEMETDEIEIELEIKSATEISKYKMEYEFEDGRPVIEIKFEIEELTTNTKTEGEMKLYITIDELTNISKYDILITIDGETYEEEHDRDFDDDDEDDDEKTNYTSPSIIAL